MSKVICDVTASIDGFTTGPNVRQAEPMGDGGEALHAWMAGDEAVDQAVVEKVNDRVGAAIVGRHTFDLGLELWGGTPWENRPCFVVTHRPEPDFVGDNGGTFAFCGLRDAVQRAKEAAGDKDVFVLGSALTRALIREGLLDELHLHLAPLLLGAGTPLFEGERAELVPVGDTLIGTVTHLRFRVAPAQ